MLQGIENKKIKFIYVKNEKGFLLGNSLTEANIEEFSNKKEGAERSIAILTISRRSGESGDNHKILLIQEFYYLNQKSTHITLY